MDKQKKGKAGAFLAGAVTTAAVGGYLLYGPKGKQHRKKVEEWVDTAKEKVGETYDSAKELGEEKAGEVGTTLKRRWRQVGKAAQKAKKAVEEELKA